MFRLPFALDSSESPPFMMMIPSRLLQRTLPIVLALALASMTSPARAQQNQQPARTPTPAPTPAGQQPPPRPTPRPTPAGGAGRQAPPRPTPRPGRTPAPSTRRGATTSAPTSVIPPRQSSIVGRSPGTPTTAPEPLPKAPKDLPVLDLIYKAEDIQKVFDKINEEIGVTVKAMEAVRGEKVDIVARDKNVEEILEELITGKEWTWILRDDGSYEVWDIESFTDKELRKLVIRKIIPIRYIVAADLQAAVDGVKSDLGQIAVNPRTNELIILDLPDKVALIESIVRELDVQLYTRTFYIRYAPFDEIQERLGEIKSDPGMIQLDSLNRRIIVTDTFQKIRQMEQLLEMLDIDQPMISYDINGLGIDGEDALELIENVIEPNLTADSFFYFSPTQGTLIVRDVIDVHNMIMDVLMSMDRSPKQVWIEGEILEVRHDFSLSFGVETTYDVGLADAFRGVGAAVDGMVPAAIALPRITSGAGGLTLLELKSDLQITANALMTDDSTRLLLQPQVLVRNLEEVLIDLTQENPQITTFFNNSQGGFNNFNSSSITFVPTGLSLSLTPAISNRGIIEMDIDFENSSPIFVELNTGSGQTQSAVGRNTQHIQTVLLIPSGETRVLGGILTRESREVTSGVPWLSRIPILGALFGSKSQDRNKRNLLFFLTPTIVQEEPQIDLIARPVNEAARRIQQETDPTIEGPVNLNILPPDLQQFLIKAEPENAGVLLPGFEPVTPGERRIPTLEQIDGMLIDDPPALPGKERLSIGFSGPGADLMKGQAGAVGPSGTLRAPTRAPVRPTAQPRRTPRPQATPRPTPPASGAPPANRQPPPGQTPARPRATPAPQQPPDSPAPPPTGTETQNR